VIFELRESGYKNIIQSANSTLLYPALILPFTAPSYEFNESLTNAAISENFIAFSSSLVNVTDNSILSKLQYIDVLFYFCTKSFSTSVKGGLSNTSDITSATNILSSNTPSLNWIWNGYLDGSLCPNASQGLSMVLDGPAGLTNETYTVDVCTALLLSNIFNIGVGGGILQNSDKTIFAVVGQISTALGINLFGDISSPNVLNSETQFQNIKRMAENIAESLTNLYGFPLAISSYPLQYN
jgi:hypothetical protein